MVFVPDGLSALERRQCSDSPITPIFTSESLAPTQARLRPVLAIRLPGFLSYLFRFIAGAGHSSALTVFYSRFRISKAEQ